MSKYLDRISLSKDEKALAGAKTAEKHAKLDTAAFIGNKEKSLATLDEAAESALAAVPFNIEKVVAINKEKAAVEADIATAKKVLASEFGE